MTMPADPGFADHTAYAASAQIAARPTPSEPGAITGAFAYQSAVLDRLEHALTILEDRLAPILRQLAPEPSAAGAATPAMPGDPQPPSAVAIEIANRTIRIDAATSYIHRLTARIDL